MILKKIWQHKKTAALFCGASGLLYGAMTGECFATLIETVGEMETFGNTATKAAGGVAGLGALIVAAAKFGMKGAATVIGIFIAAFFWKTWYAGAF